MGVKEAYLTIDDSPTHQTDALTEWLAERDIPAILFCVGSTYTDLNVMCEGMEQNPGPIRRAIDKGFLVANHTYHHQRSSEMTFAEIVGSIEKTQKLIEDFYRAARKHQDHKMIRFPHLDRGCGASVVDYDAAGKHGATLKNLFLGGLNVRLQDPTEEQIEKKQKVQDYLKREGYSAAAFKGVAFDWYNESEMADAADSLMTYSTTDWMANPDFDPAMTKDWPCRTTEKLIARMDADSSLDAEGTRHIILAHDHNNLMSVTTALVSRLQERGFRFI